MLRQFPYHIHYLVNEDLKQIVILAIIHAYKAQQIIPRDSINSSLESAYSDS